MVPNKSSIRHFVVHSGLYKPVMYLRRHLLRRHELDRVKHSIAFFKQFIKPGDLVFDVGANVGHAAEVFLACGAKVVSLEPLPHCVAELRARFSGEPRFNVVPKAIGAQPGSATLYVSRYDFMSSFDKDWCNYFVGTVDVPITTLDTVIADFGVPRFLKIDVEGWETQALAGLSQPVPLLSFEYHSGEKGYTAVVACLDRLAQLGKLKINLSGQEQWELTLPNWIEREEFLQHLDRHMKAHPDSYGDVLVQME